MAKMHEMQRIYMYKHVPGICLTHLVRPNLVSIPYELIYILLVYQLMYKFHIYISNDIDFIQLLAGAPRRACDRNCFFVH